MVSSLPHRDEEGKDGVRRHHVPCQKKTGVGPVGSLGGVFTGVLAPV